MEEKITCYCGITVNPRLEHEYGIIDHDLAYLYNPDSEILILNSTKGSRIAAYHQDKKSKGIERYLQGKQIEINKKNFDKLVKECEELFEKLSNTTKSFYELFPEDGFKFPII